MNYETEPDIDPLKPLTPGAVCLFQRFQQETDRATLAALLEAEVERHLKLCETTILYYASCTFYWCELPQHPIADVNTWAFEELKKRGFEIEHHSIGVRRKVPEGHARQSEIEAVEIRTYATASWLDVPPSKQRQREWRRRELLEDAERTKHPPQPCSKTAEGKIVESNAVWAAVLDGTFLVEVQRIHHRHFLCVFDNSGVCFQCEETHVAFGATFGPDIGNIAEWQERALTIVESRRGA